MTDRTICRTPPFGVTAIVLADFVKSNGFEAISRPSDDSALHSPHLMILHRMVPRRIILQIVCAGSMRFTQVWTSLAAQMRPGGRDLRTAAWGNRP